MSALVRQDGGPILTRNDLPNIPPAFVDATSVFNPAAAVVGGRTLLMLRIQSRGRETGLLRAWSDDGIVFAPENELVAVRGLEKIPGTLLHLYDPRLTWVEGRLLCVLAADTDAGCRLVTTTVDVHGDLDVIGVCDQPDVRNGVLFPERFRGHYLRLDRPNAVPLAGGPTTGDTIMLSKSEDLVAWHSVGPVFSGRPSAWDELIGAGPPPIKTYAGWLLVYHGVATHFAGCNIYQAGAALLDLVDPTRLIARTRRNILEPRESWELVGQVPNVVFPSGMTADRHDADGFVPDDAILRLYYGAADTCIGLATTTVGDLVRACQDD